MKRFIGDKVLTQAQIEKEFLAEKAAQQAIDSAIFILKSSGLDYLCGSLYDAHQAIVEDIVSTTKSRMAAKHLQNL